MNRVPFPPTPLPPMPPGGGLDSEQLPAILLIMLVLLALLAAINWLTLWRVARLGRLQKELSQAQMGLAQAVLASRVGEGGSHAALCRIVSSVVGQPVKDLTPLRGSVAPTYLLFREDGTRRRLLLAAAGDLKTVMQAEGIRQSRLPWRRHPVHAVDPKAAGPLVQEEIASAWEALAPKLDLPGSAPTVKGWKLAVLPPEELA